MRKTLFLLNNHKKDDFVKKLREKRYFCQKIARKPQILSKNQEEKRLLREKIAKKPSNFH